MSRAKNLPARVEPIWEEDFPPDVRAIVEPALTPWLPLLPTWLQDFRVRYRGSNENTCQVEISHRNRWAILVIPGNWLEEHPAAREQALIHELAHVVLEPLWSVTRRFVDDTTEEGTPLRELAVSVLTDGLECSVDDLARSLQRMAGNLTARVDGRT